MSQHEKFEAAYARAFENSHANVTFAKNENGTYCDAEVQNSYKFWMIMTGILDQALEQDDTPGARWRENNEPDPHDNQYDCARKDLLMGDFSDDEIANEVYMNPSIMNLTAAKDRIRWLSRQLENMREGHI